MALPRHMFCGGPDYSPTVVLTLARVDSSSINTYTRTNTYMPASKFHQLCQRLPRHDFTRQPFLASNKMLLSPEKGGEQRRRKGGREDKREEKKGEEECSCAVAMRRVSMFSTTVWECGRVILAGRPRGRLLVEVICLRSGVAC